MHRALFVNGDGAPLGRIATHISPATFFGPQGCEQGAEQVYASHQHGAAHFESGETDFEILQTAASEDIGYCVGLQRSTARLRGKANAVAIQPAR